MRPYGGHARVHVVVTDDGRLSDLNASNIGDRIEQSSRQDADLKPQVHGTGPYTGRRVLRDGSGRQHDGHGGGELLVGHHGTELYLRVVGVRVSACFGLDQRSFSIPRMCVAAPQMNPVEVLQAFHRDAPYLFLGAAFVAVGLVSAAFAAIRRKHDSLLIYFALFALFYGLRLWIQATLLGITVRGSPF